MGLGEMEASRLFHFTFKMRRKERRIFILLVRREEGAYPRRYATDEQRSQRQKNEFIRLILNAK
jgi:hypothetical protein